MIKCAAGFEAKRKPGAYIDDAMRVSSDFVAYLEGTGNLPEGARVPVVAGKPSRLLDCTFLQLSKQSAFHILIADLTSVSAHDLQPPISEADMNIRLQRGDLRDFLLIQASRSTCKSFGRKFKL